ncbi:MAG: hypothetical protein QXY43_05025 [Sulfolobales archaeon]
MKSKLFFTLSVGRRSYVCFKCFWEVLISFRLHLELMLSSAYRVASSIDAEVFAKYLLSENLNLRSPWSAGYSKTFEYGKLTRSSDYLGTRVKLARELRRPASLMLSARSIEIKEPGVVDGKNEVLPY